MGNKDLSDLVFGTIRRPYLGSQICQLVHEVIGADQRLGTYAGLSAFWRRSPGSPFWYS